MCNNMMAIQEIKSISQYIGLFAFGLKTVFPKCISENKVIEAIQTLYYHPIV